MKPHKNIKSKKTGRITLCKKVFKKNEKMLISLENGYVKEQEILAAQKIIKKLISRKGTLERRISCFITMTSKGLGCRIGKGKGTKSYILGEIKKGSVLFYGLGVSSVAMELGKKKLSIKTGII